MKKQSVGEVPGNILGMMADLNLKLQHGIRTPQQLDKFLKGENPFLGLDYSRIFAGYEKYFWKIHGLKTDFSGIRIPKADDNDFPWFVCRPENFSPERAYSGGKKLYPKWKYTDKPLDDVLNLSFGRDGETRPYIARFRANWEADENLANFSANMITEKGINTACLTERLILGDFLYWKFKRHIDVKNITLCAGSRYSDGRMPSVRWYGAGGEMRVSRYDSGGAHDSLRAREVVS